MYQLFNKDTHLSESYRVSPRFPYIVDRFDLNFNRYVAYYRGSAFRTPNNHILNRLIFNLAVPYDNDPVEYTISIAGRISTLSSLLHVASQYSGKTELTHYFYSDIVNKGDPYKGGEYIALNEDPFDVTDAVMNWESLEPVKVRSHGVSHLDMDIPDGSPMCDDCGTATVDINVPMLALQYQMWKKVELTKPREERSRLGHFTYQYPLLNMLHSHLNVALFNQYYLDLMGTPHTTSIRRHVVQVAKFDKYIDKAIDENNQYVLTHSKRFETIIDNMRLIWGDLKDTIMIPDPIISQQIAWYYTISRIPYMSYLLYVDLGNGGNSQRDTLGKIQKYNQRIFNTGTFRSNLGTKAALYWEAVVDENITDVVNVLL